MKTLVLQVYVKLDDHTGFKRFEPVKDLYALSERQAKFFAEKWGADYHQITDCDFLPDKHPVYQRLKMYEMPEYDQILYLDMDAVVLPSCPNVFEKFKDHKFTAVQNYDWDRKTDKYDEIRNRAISIYEAKPDYRPFCSGVMLIRKDFLESTKNLWRDYLYTYDKKGEHDQGIFNKMVIETGGEYNELGKEWGAWYASGKYIDHLGGPFRKHDFNLSKYRKKHKIPIENEASLEEFF